jgi:hypothetical protein
MARKIFLLSSLIFFTRRLSASVLSYDSKATLSVANVEKALPQLQSWWDAAGKVSVICQNQTPHEPI